jgi:plastocyanin
MIRLRPFAVILGLLALAAPVRAAELEVQVRAANGAPVREAVVTLHLVGRPTPAPKSAGNFAVDQQNIQFHPFVTVVPVGASVAFMNHDAVRHHVYSFSEAKRFELKLNERQTNRAVNFDKPGIVPLGCNIHDAMIAFIDVVDTAWAAKTDAAGNVMFHGLPAATMSIDVWHPYLRAPGNHLERPVALAAAGVRHEVFSLALRTPPRLPDATAY